MCHGASSHFQEKPLQTTTGGYGKKFWCQHTVDNFQLHTPFGSWTFITHIRWTWYHNEETNRLKKRKGPNTEFYVPAGNARTRSSLQYVRIGTGLEELSGKPASVQVLEGTGAKLRCSGSPLLAKPGDPSDFWDYLARQGGNSIKPRTTGMMDGAATTDAAAIEGVRGGARPLPPRSAKAEGRRQGQDRLRGVAC